MDKNLMKYVPKSKRNAVRDCWRDEDGIWMTLNRGWEAERTDSECRTIHEDTIKGLRWQIAGITKVSKKTELVFSYNRQRCHAEVVDRLNGGEKFIGSIEGWSIYQIPSTMFSVFGFIAIREEEVR